MFLNLNYLFLLDFLTELIIKQFMSARLDIFCIGYSTSAYLLKIKYAQQMINIYQYFSQLNSLILNLFIIQLHFTFSPLCTLIRVNFLYPLPSSFMTRFLICFWLLNILRKLIYLILKYKQYINQFILIVRNYFTQFISKIKTKIVILKSFKDKGLFDCQYSTLYDRFEAFQGSMLRSW